jgi:hypothetical protein
MSMSSLPQELLLYIFSISARSGRDSRHPNPDIAALRRVCRRWHPPATCIFFRNLTLDTLTGKPFLKLLSRSPYVGALVRDLTILCHHEPPRPQKRPRTAKSWMLTVLPSLGSKLTSVSTLTICDLSGARCDQVTMAHLLENYSTATCLYLVECEFLSHAQLDRLLGSFPCVRDLRLDDSCSWQRTSTLTESYSVNQRFAYKKLMLDLDKSQALWACRRLDFSSLRLLSLRLWIVSGEEPDESWSQFMRAIVHVEELELDITVLRNADIERTSFLCSSSCLTSCHVQSGSSI